MSDRHAPALATWMLNGFPFVRQNPALAGDLSELFESGRSSAWYWRQTCMIIVNGLARNIHVFRDYLGALFIGWAAQTVVVLALCWLDLPAKGHGIISAASACLLWMLPFLLIVVVKRAVVGRTSWTLQLLIRYDWAAIQHRTAMLAMVAGYTFGTGLSAYYAISRLLPRLLPHQSLAWWAGIELLWLSSDVLLAVAHPEWTFGKP